MIKIRFITVTKIFFIITLFPSTVGASNIDGWIVAGDIRAGWVQYGYGNKPLGIDASNNVIATDPKINQGHIDSQGVYAMPKLSIISPKDSRFGVKLTLAGATDVGINDEKYESLTLVFDPNERKSFVLVQEAYLKYEDKTHKFLVGREEIDTPMINADDWYMLSDSFELAYYVNNSIENLEIRAGYFNRMAGVWDSGTNGTEFNSMSQASYIDAVDKRAIGNKGIYFAALNYNDEHRHDFQVWNYYGEDMYNTFFMQYDYTNNIGSLNYDVGVQFINFEEVGYLASDVAVTNISYSIYSAKFDGDFSNGINFATGISKYSDGEGQGTTLGAFGGYPYFTIGMVFHFFEAGSLQNATAYKAQIGYDFSKLGVDDLWVGYAFTLSDLDAKYSKNANGDRQETMVLNGIQFSYGDEAGAYFTGTYEHVNLDNEPNTFALRLIGGYKF